MSIILTPDMDDLTLAKAARKATRSDTLVTIAGTLGAPLGPEAPSWIAPLAAARGMVELSAGGEIGQRGLTLALLSDRIKFDSPRATPEDAHHPLIAAVAAHRLGALAARGLHAAPDPIGYLNEIGHGAGGVRDSAIRQAWRAMAELPFGEGLDFAALLNTPEERSQ